MRERISETETEIENERGRVRLREIERGRVRTYLYVQAPRGDHQGRCDLYVTRQYGIMEQTDICGITIIKKARIIIIIEMMIVNNNDINHK